MDTALKQTVVLKWSNACELVEAENLNYTAIHMIHHMPHSAHLPFTH